MNKRKEIYLRGMYLGNGCVLLQVIGRLIKHQSGSTVGFIVVWREMLVFFLKNW